MPTRYHIKFFNLKSIGIHCWFIGGVICFLSHNPQLMAQQGQPFITNFPPIHYKSNAYTSSPQNWGVSQAKDGVLYIANTSGVLVYDGNKWQIVSGTEDKLFFKFAQDNSGRIYTGGIGDLGYFQANKKGEIEYISLKSKLPKSDHDFGRVVNVVSQGKEVFFKSKKYLFKWSDGKFRIWKNETRFVKVVSSNAGVFVSEKMTIYQLKGDSLHKVLEGREGGIPNMRGIFKGHGDTLLLVSRNRGLFKLHNGDITPIDNGMGLVTILNGCELMHEDQLAITTVSRGIVIINRKGDLIDILDKSKGLDGDYSIFPFYNKGTLWAAMNSGVSELEYPYSISILNRKKGLDATPTCITQFDNKIFLGTDGNAYWLKQDKLHRNFSLDPIQNTVSEVYCALSIDDKLIAGTTEGLLVISNKGQTYEIPCPTDQIFSVIESSKKRKGIIYAGYGNSLSVIEIKDNTYQNVLDTLQIPHYVNHLVETEDGNLWATQGGASYIDFQTSLTAPKVTTLDSSNGLKPEMGIVEVNSVNGDIIFSTELGVYTFDHTIQQLIPYPIFGNQFCDGSHIAYNLTEMRNGDVWATTNNQTGLLRKQPNNSFIYDSLPIIRAPLSDVWDIYEDSDEVVWICSTEGIVRYDPHVEFDYHRPYYTLVRSVRINNDTKEIFSGNYSDKNGFPATTQPESYVPELTIEQNNITFRYAATYFVAHEKLEYSVLLEGQDHEWSPWSGNTKMQYTNLPEGEYIFKVKARNVYGTISEVAEYKFIIQPPWYRTVWAYVSYAIGAFLFIFLIVKLNSRRLVRDKRRLEGIVEERTQEVRSQKDSIVAQAQALENAYEQLVELDNFKEGMTSMIVHDLKNPLNAIINSSQNITDPSQLVKIKQSGQQMLTMVLNILDVYKYENSTMTVEQVSIEMEKLVNNTLSDIRFLVEQKGIALTVNLQETATISGDAEILNRVLVNLLTNAIKYSAAGNSIDINGYVDNGQYRLEVCDHGAGIKPENLASVFDKFQQIKSKDSGGVRSTGLGLTFCKMAVTAHQGTIGVESEFGQGSCFWFTLPITDQSSIKQATAEVVEIQDHTQLVLSENGKSYLNPLAVALKEIPFYKISTLRKKLKEVDTLTANDDVKLWLEQFERAAQGGLEDQMTSLIDEVLEQ
jgi:signal transduction histidine kinase